MSSDWLGALSRQNHSVGRAAPDRLRSAEPAALTGVLRRFYEAERPLPPLRRAASRRTSSAGRTVPDRLRSTESAARTGVLRRFYEAERPLPLLWRVDFRRSAAAGRTPVGLARGFPAGFFCGTNRAFRRRFGARISGGLLLRDEPRSPPPLWCADFRWNPSIGELWRDDFEALNPLM